MKKGAKKGIQFKYLREKMCRWCSKEFIPKRKDQKLFCCKACKKMADLVAQQAALDVRNNAYRSSHPKRRKSKLIWDEDIC